MSTIKTNQRSEYDPFQKKFVNREEIKVNAEDANRQAPDGAASKIHGDSFEFSGSQATGDVRRPPHRGNPNGPSLDKENQTSNGEQIFGQDQFQGGEIHGRNPHHGSRNHFGPMNAQDNAFPGPPPAMQSPVDRAKKLFSEIDSDGNGSITQADMEAYFKAQEAVLEQTEEDQTTVSQTVDTSATAVQSTESTVSTEDPAAIKAEILAEMSAYQEDSSYENLSDVEKQSITDGIEAVNALDPTDPQFLEKLQQVIGGNE